MEDYEPNRKRLNQSSFAKCRRTATTVEFHKDGRCGSMSAFTKCLDLQTVILATRCTIKKTTLDVRDNCMVKIIFTSFIFFGLSSDQRDVSFDVHQLGNPILMQGMAAIPGVVGRRTRAACASTSPPCTSHRTIGGDWCPSLYRALRGTSSRHSTMLL